MQQPGKEYQCRPMPEQMKSKTTDNYLFWPRARASQKRPQPYMTAGIRVSAARLDHHPLQLKNFGRAIETLRRPTAGQQGGVQGGHRPPAQHYSFIINNNNRSYQ